MPKHRPDHFLNKTSIKETFRHPILSRREDFLLVAKQGKPNFAERPLAVTSSFVAVSDFEITNGTSLADPRVENAGRLALAHMLVEDIHRFLTEEHPAPDVSQDTIDLISSVAAAVGEDIVATHVLYSGHDAELASAVFVSRTLTRTNQMIGTVPDFDETKIGQLDIDLLGLIAAERSGTSTSLRTFNSVETRALGAVGLLVDQPTLQSRMDRV